MTALNPFLKNMINAASLWIVLSTLFFCVGCGEPKLDTSSDQAFSTSLEKIYNSVPETEREDFRGYLNIAMGLKGGAPSYDKLVQLYSLIKARGNENERTRINDLNGMTKNDIITRGKTVLKNELEEQLETVNIKIEAATSYIEELKKINIEIGAVEAFESKSPLRKGMIGSLGLDVTIKNGSSKKLRNFKGGQVIFFDENGKEVGKTYLSSFMASNGKALFNDLLGDPGLEAGETIKGHVTTEVSGLPFPPQSTFKAVLTNEPFTPILDVGYQFYGKSAQKIEQELEQLNKEKAFIQTIQVKLKL